MVAQWLTLQKLEMYANEFMAKKINGQQLLQLDSSQLKVLSIVFVLTTSMMPNSVICAISASLKSSSMYYYSSESRGYLYH